MLYAWTIILLLVVSPKPLCLNWLYIGKCYLHLDHKTEARRWLQRVVECEGHCETEDDCVSCYRQSEYTS